MEWWADRREGPRLYFCEPRFLAVPSQMCVFSQVLVVLKFYVCGSLLVCMCACVCGCAFMCDINLGFVRFSHRRRRTVSA